MRLPGRHALVTAVVLVLAGCPATRARFDFDGDGFEDALDCRPEDPESYPGAPDPFGDLVDTDCDGFDGVDRDVDGYPLFDEVFDDAYDGTYTGWDCNDANATIHPGAGDPLGDSVDNNCDGIDGLDVDGDGHAAGEGTNLDCDDSDETIHPDAAETANCIDDDCDGAVDEQTASVDDDGDGFCEGVDLGAGMQCCDQALVGDCDDSDPALQPVDVDGDGWSSCDGDCDDDDPGLHPGAEEICNLLDDDCDGDLLEGEVDADGDLDPACTDCDDDDPTAHSRDDDLDGWSICEGDCDDTQTSFNPAETDIVGDGYDQNCDHLDGTDTDQDRYASIASGGNDCDDTDGTLNLDDADADGWTTCDGDCDDGDALLNLDDLDGDGLTTCASDCDDGDADIHPGAAEICDGKDNDCEGGTDENVDDDGDGYDECDGDCDDAEPMTWPGAAEQCDLADNDCDGDVDEGVDDDGDGDGWFPCQGDCDDLDIDTYPSAPEICDGVDNDCDGTVPADEADDDGDGYPDCAGDCDDTDIYANPGAPERCDGVDNDCDGIVDEICFLCDQVVAGTSIQDAMDAAFAADVICVEPDTYHGTLVVPADDLSLYGLAGPYLTILDGDHLDRVVSTTRPGIVHGFTVRHGYTAENGAGILIEDQDPTLEWLVIRNNSAEVSGGGVAIHGLSAPWIANTRFEGNDAGVGGGGAHVEGDGQFDVASPTLTSVVFVDNDASGDASAGGGGLHLNCYADGHVENATFAGNTADYGGGGLQLVCGDLTVERVLFVDNATQPGNNVGGAISHRSGSLAIWNSAFLGNEADWGGAIRSSRNLWINGSVFAHNTARAGGGAIYVEGTNQPVTVTRTVFASNVSTLHEGGAISLAGGDVTLSYTNVWANDPDDYGEFDPTGIDGNIAVDPEFLDRSHPDPLYWDLHLVASSPLVDAGDPNVVDPDGSTSDIGIYGGTEAAYWDLDQDGYFEWWQPGVYDDVAFPALGWDCDDRTAGIHPGDGC
jgi:hypothetical protein